MTCSVWVQALRCTFQESLVFLPLMLLLAIHYLEDLFRKSAYETQAHV